MVIPNILWVIDISFGHFTWVYYLHENVNPDSSVLFYMNARVRLRISAFVTRSLKIGASWRFPIYFAVISVISIWDSVVLLFMTSAVLWCNSVVLLFIVASWTTIVYSAALYYSVSVILWLIYFTIYVVFCHY